MKWIRVKGLTRPKIERPSGGCFFSSIAIYLSIVMTTLGFMYAIFVTNGGIFVVTHRRGRYLVDRASSCVLLSNFYNHTITFKMPWDLVKLNDGEAPILQLECGLN